MLKKCRRVRTGMGGKKNFGKNQHLKKSFHSPRVSTGLVLSVAGLEGDLEDPPAEAVHVERLYGHQALLVVGHRDEPEPLALAGCQVPDHLDTADRPERPEQLPQDVLLRLRGEVVDEDAPAGAVHTRQDGGATRGQEISSSQGGIAWDYLAT